MSHRFLVRAAPCVCALLAIFASCDAYDASLLSAFSAQGADSGVDRLPYIEGCGNGQRDEGEQCDTAIAEGEEGSCPTSCPTEDPCNQQVLAGNYCQTQCVGLRTTKAINDDGCCPPGIGAGEDSDCGSCGDGIIGPTETCEPGKNKCPTRESCTALSPCLITIFTGDPESCSSKCELQQIEQCQNGDGCCPASCNAESDGDCSTSCGNGIVELESGEICEPTSTTDPCPEEGCDDHVACTTDLQTGSAANCNLACSNVEITAPVTGDGCCPDGANARNDGDCLPVCGNGVPEGDEVCDPCPATCDDFDSCTANERSGSGCDVTCSYPAITTPTNGDGCCPPGANATNDTDCPAVCGNQLREGYETCDPCPANCSDGNVCTTDQTTGSAASCTLVCSHPAITQPANGDGCCPSGANSGNDSDCAPACGNGVVDSGEECDGGGLCRDCELLFHSSLVHRYSFNGTGTTVTDSVGTAHGTAVNCTVSNGAVDLQSSVSNNYVRLPAGLISSLSAVTFEVWLKWDGGDNRQRIFDFGYSTGGSSPALGTSFFMLEPANSNDKLATYVNFTSASSDAANDWPALHTGALSQSGTQHVAVTFNGTQLKLYSNGTLRATYTGSAKSLSSIDDRNNWLGRSQFSADPELDGILYEFRIYSSALSASQITASYNAGSDP